MTKRPYTTRSRDRFRAGTAILTGLAAFGAVAGTGFATAVVARATETDQAEKAKQKAVADAGREARWQSVGQAPVAAQPVLITKRRPHRVIVRTTVVHQVSSPSAGTVGSGGTVSSSSSGSSSSYTPRRSSSPRPAPRPAPAPAPAPSSGS